MFSTKLKCLFRTTMKFDINLPILNGWTLESIHDDESVLLDFVHQQLKNKNFQALIQRHGFNLATIRVGTKEWSRKNFLMHYPTEVMRKGTIKSILERFTF